MLPYVCNAHAPYACFICCISNNVCTFLCLHPSIADVDYVTLIRNITFDSGENSKDFSVAIRDDQIAESDETFEVFLKPIPNSLYDVMIDESSVAMGTIFDDEIPSMQNITTQCTFTCS